MSIKNIGTRYQRKNEKRPFQNSWNITYRKPNYDALGDPHASYYFLNKSVRKHLTSLKKSIQREGSFTERKKIRYLIGERIKQYQSKNMTTKVEAYYFNMRSSPSISSLNSKRSKKSLDNQQINEQKQQRSKNEKNKRDASLHSKTIQVRSNARKINDEFTHLPKISEPIKDLDKMQPNREQNKLNSLNKTEHNKFLKFITDKKRKLQSHRTLVEQQDKRQNNYQSQKVNQSSQ